jgi:hypothetical protein
MFHSGKLSAENCKKIWQLFKKTSGPCLAPYPASAIFQVQSILIPPQISSPTRLWNDLVVLENNTNIREWNDPCVMENNKNIFYYFF